MRTKPLKIKISRDLGMLIVLSILIVCSIANRNEFASAIAFMYIPVGITIMYYLVLVRYPQKIQKHHIALVLIFVASSLSTWFYSTDKSATVSAITASFLWILMTILLTSVYYERKTIVRIINIYTIVAFVLSINTLYNFSAGMINPESDRVITTVLGTLKDNNFYAAFLTPAYAYSFYRFVNIKKNRMYFLAASVVMFLAIVFTGSRAAFIALLLMTGITVIGFMISEKMSGKKLIMTILFMGILVAAYFYISNTTMYERLTDTEDYTSDVRMRLWSAAFEVFVEHPIFGGGRSAANLNAISKWGNYAHNTYLEILCDQGLVGAGLFLWLFFSFFKVQRENIVFMLTLFVGFFAPLLFISAYQSCSFWLGISLCLIFSKYLKTNSVKDLLEGEKEEV